MKKISTLMIIFLATGTITINAQHPDITTIIIVRHAEKERPAQDAENMDMMKNDLRLTEAGEKRAAKLAAMLSKSKVSAVFSTNTTRTIETVNNYADEQGLQIIIYDETESLAEKIKSNYKGRKILVSAHSNTIGPLMEALGTDSVPQIDHDYYSGFFIVTITADNRVSWLHLEY
jgi:broad specificity phosphatase PhoE